MTGSLAVDDRAGVDQMHYAPRRRDPAWDRWTVRFDDGGTLVVHDPRRLGGVSLDPDVSALGPDAATISPKELAASLAGTHVAVKARLLDQSQVAGVGNLIADEVLWRASLSPLRPSDSLTPNEVRRLHRHLGRTIAELTRRGGFPHRGPDGRAPPRGPLPPGRNRADPVHRGRAHLVVVPPAPGLKPLPDQPSISASTLAAWPSAFTWYQGRAILPSAAMRKVERITPIDFLP